MYVSIHHTIANPQKWEEVTKNLMALVEQGRLPQGVKTLMYLPHADGRTADCLWEAHSLETLRNFLDREIGEGAKNEYFEIKAEDAYGLPGQVQEQFRKAA